MLELSVTIEGWAGVDWPSWKRIVREVEQLGFDALYISDHFAWQYGPSSAVQNALESIVALTYLADHTQRVRFGAMVSPLSVRDPIMLTRQAVLLDDLSGGRMILGVGAGWHEGEHRMFGYDLGDIPARMARLEEGLEVITRLLRSDEPVSYEGRFYRLRDATLIPRPRRPDTLPILIGGKGPKKTLPLVARYADIWNTYAATPDEFGERSAILDDLLRASGRKPQDVKRSMMFPVLCWRNEAELAARMRIFRQIGFVPPEVSPNEAAEILRGKHKYWFLGTTDAAGELIRAYEAAGLQELIFQWIGYDDIEGLRLLAEEVMSQFR